MSSFNPQIITKLGEELIARALAEDGEIHWTRVALGDGSPGGDAAELEALISPKLDAILINNNNLGETVELIAKFSNETIVEEFDIKELGIFGKIEGDAESILYSYSTANDYSRIPTNTNPFEMEWSIYTQVTNGDKIDILINPTLQMLNKETADLFYVPLTRTINGKQLDKNLVLSYEDLTGCKYDIGDYWITESIANPAVKWTGTTWAKLEDRVLLGASSGYALGSEGGRSAVSLVLANMAAHTHWFSATAATAGEHYHQSGSHRHQVDSHAHTQPTHAHAMTLTKNWGDGGATNHGWGADVGSNGSYTNYTDSEGGQNTGASAPYTNYQNPNTSATGNHNHTVSGNTGSAGSGSAFDIMNPYRAVNIWRRTA